LYQISKMDDKNLLNMGISQDEINILKDREDPRNYAMKNWGWVRIQDKYVQAWIINPQILKNISNGLYEAFGNEVFTQKYEVESFSNNKIYSSVPYDVIDSAKPSALRYFQYGAIASAFNKKIAQNNNCTILSPEELDQFYPKINGYSDGRIIREDIPNMSSIASSLNDYIIIPGIRNIPLSEFSLSGTSYSMQEINRINLLSQQIKQSNEINPLIVVMDEQGLYILEGGHRAEALYLLKANYLPAKLILDIESMVEANCNVTLHRASPVAS